MTIPLILKNWDDKSDEAEAVVINWFVRNGQPVKQEQLLAEVMVEKTNLEIIAPQPGLIHSILAPEGTIVTPGTVLALLEENPPAVTVTSNGTRHASEEKVKDITPPRTELYIAASPAARRLAKLLRIDLGKIASKLPPNTRLNEAAVRDYIETLLPADVSVVGEDSNPTPARVEGQSNLRRLIRRRVSRSVQQSAAVTLTSRADVTQLLRWLYEHPSSPDGIQATLLAAIIRATALSLIEYPLLNSTLVGDDVLYLLERNIGLVLPVPEGVAVPVVREADKLSLTQLATIINQLDEAARQGTLRLKDTRGGSFTVSDLGSYGVDSFTPILNLDQAAGLGIGRVNSEPLWTNPIVSITHELHKYITLSFTFDHRIADGPTASVCLQTIVNFLQNPQSLA